MRPVLPYYGGKATLAPAIITMIPEHICYTEPFLGGGAVFWAKEPSEVEVINDTNGELINFYEVLKREFPALYQKVQISLHSRSQFRDAKVIYNAPHLFNRIDRAWAVWVLATQGFSSKLDGHWGYDKKRKTTSKKINNRKLEFNEELAIRLQHVQIECTDALRIIRSRDYKDAVHYCDPPYWNSDCGHYDGYTKEDFEMLLQTLEGIQGKFLLSSYRSPDLKTYTKRNGWYTLEKKLSVTVNNKSKSPNKQKIEVLTANYPINWP